MSTVTWIPIADCPDEFRDGRPVLVWDGFRPFICWYDKLYQNWTVRDDGDERGPYSLSDEATHVAAMIQGPDGQAPDFNYGEPPLIPSTDAHIPDGLYVKIERRHGLWPNEYR